MDSYLASRELAQANHFYLNINFELLNGCKFNCRGCYVEKNSQTPITEEQFTNIDSLLKNLEGSLYQPFIAFVGPTDFLVADNFEAVFGNEKIISLFKHFKRLSLQTTYLGMKNAEKIATIINNNFSDMELEINIVIDPAKIMDDNYLGLLETNKNQFLSLLHRSDVRTFGIMNVFNYDQTKIPQLLKNYDFIHQRVEHLIETSIDYNFSAGRKLDLTNEEFSALTDRVKNLFENSEMSNKKEEFLKFGFGKLTDALIERQYNYRGGDLYHSPLLFERFVAFRDELKIPLKDFNSTEIELYERNLQLKQFMYAPTTEECEECPFVASCIDRGILHLMETFDVKQCVVSKNALFAVNNMGALPINPR